MSEKSLLNTLGIYVTFVDEVMRNMMYEVRWVHLVPLKSIWPPPFCEAKALR